MTFDRPVVVTEAVYLPATPAEPMRALQAAARHAIAEALGQPQDARPYRPHISLAYVAADQAGKHIADAIDARTASAATVQIDNAHLLEFHRDNHMYEWTSALPIAVGSSRPHLKEA